MTTKSTMSVIESTVANLFFENGLTPVDVKTLKTQLAFAYQNMKLSEADWKYAASTFNVRSFNTWLRFHAAEADVFEKAIERYGVAIYYFRNMVKARVYFNLLNAMK